MPKPNNASRDWIAEAPLSDSVRALAQRGELCRFAKNTLLIQEGAFGDTIYIILDGKLRVYASTTTSDREFTYNHYEPGEYVGEMGLDGGPRSANVMATEPTVCSMVTRRTLEQYLQDQPAFAFELIAKVIRRARSATLSAKSIALNDVYGRLKQWLEANSEPLPDGRRRVAERITHLELSNRLACSREMVTRQLKDLQTGGYIAIDHGEILILKTLPPRW